MLKIASIALLSLLLGACASQAPKQTKYEGSFEELTANEKYVATVNRQARRSGVDVTWINPPTKNDEKKKKGNK